MKHDGCFISTVELGEEGRPGGSCSNSWIKLVRRGQVLVSGQGEGHCGPQPMGRAELGRGKQQEF